MPASVISLELNELCSDLIDRWIDEGVLPNFKALRDSSHVFLTLADTDKPDELEPWIQWYSVHTGLPYRDHCVFHLTDGRQASHPDIWRQVIEQGGKTINFSSMNARPFTSTSSVFVADPWCEKDNASPPELNIYNRFVAHNVREYSNAQNSLSLGDYWKFFRFLVTHGLKAATIRDIICQLAAERIRPEQSYRRVAILDALQFDVFAHYYRKVQPDFASFFVNSVAHLQHGFWRHMEPQSFDVQPSENELLHYGNAIRNGYIAMDKLIGKMRRLADRYGATIVMQTALSQQPFTRYEASGGQRFHRLKSPKDFLKLCDISATKVEPVMTHQYMLTFDNEQDRRVAYDRLVGFELESGKKLFGFSELGSATTLHFGCQVSQATDPDCRVVGRMSNMGYRFGDLLYAMDGTKSGCHHPQGALWMATGQHHRHEDAVSILDVFPTIADMLMLQVSDSQLEGTTLLPKINEIVVTESV